MSVPGRLSERAVDGGLGPIWHVDRATTFFAGPLTYNASHQHGAPVYLAGLYGSFRLRVPGGAWVRCRTAMIPAGMLHELEVGGEPIGVLYVEPDAAGLHALTPLLRDAHEIDGVLVGAAGESRLMREVYEDRSGAGWAGAAMTDLVRVSSRQARAEIDLRVAQIAQRLNAGGDARTSAAHLAGSVGLSSSRLQHLFTQEIGVPLRRYRAWSRMRRAIDAIVGGNNFTEAAHAVGYADQAHFAHDFRRTFGAPASGSLLNIRR